MIHRFDGDGHLDLIVVNGENGENGVTSELDSAAAGDARWLQYKATFVSLNGCRSPRLEEVRVDFER